MRFLVPLLLLPLCAGSAAPQAQQRPNSPVLKSYVPSDSHAFVIPGDAEYELWQNFSLVRKANDGDPVAQHELGIRYISGRGFSADTEKAAYWIGRAAAQKLPSACYNLAILQSNGWGVPWDPFAAYTNVRFAASREMPEALYVLGLFYLDNLVLPRDEREASCYIRAAADSGYAPAFETLLLTEKRGGTASEAAGPPEAAPGPAGTLSSRVIFLDFTRDTSSHSSDTTLAQELSRSGSEALSLLPPPLPGQSNGGGDSTLLRAATEAAEAGSPEALTIMGRWRATGTFGRKDELSAAVFYLRALRFDSPRAPELLWHLVHEQGFFATLKAEVDRGRTDAMFVWAALIGAQFDFQLTGEQAVALLERAVRSRNVQAMLELGSWKAQGRLVANDRRGAVELWNEAASLGSREAEIRLMVSEIMGEKRAGDAADLVPKLASAVREGSVLAEVALGSCFERGIGVPRHAGEAARLYRAAAQRGSAIGFAALKRMYDNLRPPDAEYRVPE